MTGAGSGKVLQALLVATGLLAVTLFTLANFVLVDVRLPGGVAHVRLAWVAVVPALCAYGAGRLSDWLHRWEVVESALPERRERAEAAGDEERHGRQANDDGGRLPAPRG